MNCPKCGSSNTNIQIVNEVTLKRKHNWVYWLCCFWLVDIFLWILFFGYRLILAIIAKIFRGTKYKTINKEHKMLICQDCGYTKKIK